MKRQAPGPAPGRPRYTRDQRIHRGVAVKCEGHSGIGVYTPERGTGRDPVDPVKGSQLRRSIPSVLHAVVVAFASRARRRAKRTNPDVSRSPDLRRHNVLRVPEITPQASFWLLAPRIKNNKHKTHKQLIRHRRPPNNKYKQLIN